MSQNILLRQPFAHHNVGRQSAHLCNSRLPIGQNLPRAAVRSPVCNSRLPIGHTLPQREISIGLKELSQEMDLVFDDMCIFRCFNDFKMQKMYILR